MIVVFEIGILFEFGDFYVTVLDCAKTAAVQSLVIGIILGPGPRVQKLSFLCYV
jgi:hypothetical protein